MLQRARQGIDQVHIHKGAEHSREYKGSGMEALHLQKPQVPQTYDQSLNKTDHNKKKPSAEVCLGCGKVPDTTASVNFHFQNRN